MNWFIPAAVAAITGLFGKGKSEVIYRPDPEMQRQMAEIQARMVENAAATERQRLEWQAEKKLLEDRITEYLQTREQMEKDFQNAIAGSKQEIERLQAELEDWNIKDLSQLEKVNKKKFEQVIKLSKAVPARPIDGINIGLFGKTGVGKSSLLNALMGQELCKVSRNQTTREATCYQPIIGNLNNAPVKSDKVYWDIPGTTDEVHYFDVEYIALLKRMDFLGIMTDRTCDEVTATMRFLEALGIPYALIDNKYDDKMDEINQFKEVYLKEVQERGIRPTKIYFVSAKHKGMGDWVELAKDVAATTLKQH